MQKKHKISISDRYKTVKIYMIAIKNTERKIIVSKYLH